MAVSRNHRENDPFVRLHKGILYDKRISLKAKAIMALAFARPDNWKFYKNEMMSHSTDGEHSFDSGLEELEKYGYLHRSRRRDGDTGQWQGWEWDWYEVPISPDEFKKVNRNGGFPRIGETPRSVNPPPNKKECLSKKERQQQQPPKEAPPVVVVFPVFDELNIPEPLKAALSSQIDAEGALKLVQRVKAWKGRESDARACNTILARWETWEDHVEKSDIAAANREWADEHLKPFDIAGFSPTIGRFCCDVLSQAVEFIAPGGGMAQPTCIGYDNPNFTNLVKDFLKKNGVTI